jgi:hypothetical protein
MQEPDEPPRHPFGVGHPIAREPATKVLGLADVKDAVMGTAHQIDARPAWQSPKEGLTQTLDERPRRREQPKLTGGHASS